jgi:hypothetical protein
MYKPIGIEPWKHLLHECTDAMSAVMRDFREYATGLHHERAWRWD